MSAKYLMSSLTRHVTRNVRHVSTSTHVMATYQVHLVHTKGEFNKNVMKNDKIVLMEFTAAWCRPCRNLHPKLKAGILKSEIDLDLAKVDLARKFKTRKIEDGDNHSSSGDRQRSEPTLHCSGCDC